MDLKSAHEELITWIKTRLDKTQQELAEAEAKLVEVKALVKQKRANVAYFQNKLEAELSSNELAAEISSALVEDREVNGNLLSEQAPTANPSANSGNVGQGIFLDDESQEESFEENERENQDDRESHKRNPRDMLYREFRGQTLGEAAEIILDSFAYPVTPEQIASRLFDPKSDHEQLRAKNSLSTELRRGAKEGRWKKVGRGLFASNSFHEEVTDEINN